ncbi:MAG: YitT family protein [Bacilli bacterium]|nr:YitT family protein [Bacilli bacterium]
MEEQKEIKQSEEIVEVKKKKRVELKTKFKELKSINFLYLTIAGIINAFGVTLFLYPVKLYDSGISGTSMLLDQITPAFLTLPMFLVVLNIPIFIFGLKRQGLAFTIYSIFTVIIYSLMSYLIMYVLPIDVSIISPLAGSDLLLCAIFGGVISGVGSGLTIRFGGAIDGIDILSVVFAKKIGISIGAFVMIFNTILYIICGIAINSWILPLYSIVTYFVGSKTVNFIVEGFNRSKCAMIVTTKAKEVSEAISNQFGASGTIVNAIGGFSKEEKNIIYFIINHFQINKLKQIVHDIDDKAFISLQDVSDIIKAKAQ